MNNVQEPANIDTPLPDVRIDTVRIQKYVLSSSQTVHSMFGPFKSHTVSPACFFIDMLLLLLLFAYLL